MRSTLIPTLSSLLLLTQYACASPTIAQTQLQTKTQANIALQDITTLSAYPLQSLCARNCFVRTGSCWIDVLWHAIGCAPRACTSVGWQATNDCYCQLELQQSAYRHITSCIRDACVNEAGNLDEIVNNAKSIYGQHCGEKGYTDVVATAVKLLGRETGSATTTTKASRATNTSTPQRSSPWYKKLPTGAWIGIGIGICAVLALLTMCIKGHTPSGGGVGPAGGQDGAPVINLVNSTNYLATHGR